MYHQMVNPVEVCFLTIFMEKWNDPKSKNYVGLLRAVSDSPRTLCRRWPRIPSHEKNHQFFRLLTIPRDDFSNPKAGSWLVASHCVSCWIRFFGWSPPNGQHQGCTMKLSLLLQSPWIVAYNSLFLANYLLYYIMSYPHDKSRSSAPWMVATCFFTKQNKGCLPSVKDRGPPAQDHLKGPKDLGKSGDFKLQWLQEGCCKPEMMINLEL